MLAFALVIHRNGINVTFTGMTITRALASDSDVTETVKVSSQHCGIGIAEAIDQKLVIGKDA